MVDKNTIFGGMLTLLGAAKKTNCDALGIPWEPRFMLIGDANGTDPVPDPSQTMLVNQVYRAQLNQLYVSPTDNNVLVAELVLPPDVGGWWVRELALEDKDGVFSAVSNVAPSYKPQLAQNSGRNQVVRMHIITSSTANIQLKIDPSVVLATRSYVDTKIMEELYKLDSKQSVLVATTANIALAGLQVIDGVSVPAGARVLVKNQAVAKDNGIWIAAAPVWTRAPDADTNAEVTSALLVSVEQGTTQADTRWQLVTDGVIVLGTTALTFQNVTQGYAPINSPALLGAPTALTPPQFDNSLRLVNTAFAKRMGVEYSGFAPLTASTALGASSIGGIVAGASATPINITLPPTAGVPEGATVEVVNAGAGAVTVLAAGLDVLASQVAGVIPVVLGMGDNAKFVKVSGTWRLRGGSMSLKYAAVMAGPNWTTPPQFDSTAKFATTAFAQSIGQNFAGRKVHSATENILASDMGKMHLANSAVAMTLTLPAASSVPPGAAFTIMGTAGGVATISRAGTDNIVPMSTPVLTINLGNGDVLTFVSNGVDLWYVFGSSQLAYASAMSGPNWTTQPQFASDKSFATTEFVKRAGGSFAGWTNVGASRSLTAADIGKLVWFSSAGSYVLTLPSPTSLGIPDGSSFNIFATSTSGSLATSGGTNIQDQGGALVTSFNIGIGQSAKIVAIGPTQWLVTDSTAGLGKNADFAASLAGSICSQKLPGGQIEQWGIYVGIASGADVVITLPVAMLAAPTCIDLTFANFANGEAVGAAPVLQARSSAGGTITVRNLHTATSSFFWKVKGRV